MIPDWNPEILDWTPDEVEWWREICDSEVGQAALYDIAVWMLRDRVAQK